MTRKEAVRQNHQADTLRQLGFTYDEAEALRRISLTLHRWHEHECNGAIQRDGETGVPYWFSPWSGCRLHRVADREKGALTRLTHIINACNQRAVLPGQDAPTCPCHPVGFYVQTDPRGAALYILRPGDVPEGQAAESYYTRGIVVY